ncbi:MAG: hypothetical protein ACYSX0_22770 [Planctomycetota bacterium]
MVRKAQVPLKEICETFSVSRQTLHRAMEKLDEISIQALKPQKAGRKGKSEEQKMVSELATRKSELEKELSHWKTKYEIAKTFLDLERKYDRGEPLPGQPEEEGEKKLRNRRKRERKRRREKKKATARATVTALHAGPGNAARMESTDDGGADGHDASQSQPLGRTSTESGEGSRPARQAGGDTDRGEVEDP